VPQASADLAAYRSLAPENIEYNGTKRKYVAAAAFEPKLLEPNAERYLAQLRAIADGVITLDDTLIAELPDVSILPIPSRRIEPKIFRGLLKAVRAECSIRIHYQSMNDKRPHPIWREITPHAFGWDGFRWHVRAFCHIERRFKDFVISRCLDLGEFGVPGEKAINDQEWNTFFDIILIPNPKLSAAQRKTIELDYGMTRGKTSVSVRRALLYYFDKRLRLDVAERQDRPKETPVVVKNREAYDKELRQVAY